MVDVAKIDNLVSHHYQQLLAEENLRWLDVAAPDVEEIALQKRVLDQILERAEAEICLLRPLKLHDWEGGGMAIRGTV